MISFNICMASDNIFQLVICNFWYYRLGETVDRALLNHLLKMFTALGIYSESFEKPFLECTSEFYAAEGMNYMQQSDVPDYLKHVEVPIVFPLVLFSKWLSIYIYIIIYCIPVLFNGSFQLLCIYNCPKLMM